MTAQGQTALAALKRDFRSVPESRHSRCSLACLERAKSRLHGTGKKHLQHWSSTLRWNSTFAARPLGRERTLERWSAWRRKVKRTTSMHCISSACLIQNWACYFDHNGPYSLNR